eukprot:6388424-Prymnesium_polylepis.1
MVERPPPGGITQHPPPPLLSPPKTPSGRLCESLIYQLSAMLRRGPLSACNTSTTPARPRGPGGLGASRVNLRARTRRIA